MGKNNKKHDYEILQRSLEENNDAKLDELGDQIQ